MMLFCAVQSLMLVLTQVLFEEALDSNIGWLFVAGFLTASQAVINERIFKIDRELEPMQMCLMQAGWEALLFVLCIPLFAYLVMPAVDPAG